MARMAKKEIVLTPEEKLAQALVPKEDQPFRVPENWCWIKWGEAGEFISGNGFKNEYQGFTEYEIPFYKVGSLKYSDANGYIYDGSNTINEEIRLKLKASLIPQNSVLFAKIGEAIRLNRRSINKIACCIDNNMIAFVPKCLMRYVFYWSCGIDLYDYTNATTVPAIRKSDLEAIPFPLAPLAEQQRIVDRIESLFAKLDEAKEKAQEVIDGFDSRRAAILALAFSGKLTEKWRRENGVKNCWELRRFDEVAAIKSNLVDPAEYQDFPHIAPDNIEKRTGVLLEYHTIAEDGMTSGKHRFYPGQILYSKIRPYLSKVVMVDFDGLCSADMYPIEAKQNTRFLWYYMLSDEFLEAASSAGSRSVLPKINQKELSKMPVRITESEDEQGEVVRILDGIYAKENEARTLAETVIDKIDEVKKSVLVKAFGGELGTQDSSDEPAEELLKRILSEANVEEKMKLTTRKTRMDVAMNKDMLEAVKEAKKITPEKLKQETGLEIDEFYEQLKKLIESGKAKEVRESGEVYLEVVDAD